MYADLVYEGLDNPDEILDEFRPIVNGMPLIAGNNGRNDDRLIHRVIIVTSKIEEALKKKG